MSAALMRVTKGNVILVPILKVDIPFTFNMPNGMDCTIKIRLPSFKLHDINIKFPNPIAFTAAQLQEKTIIQEYQSALRASASKLGSLAKNWFSQQIDQTQAATSIVKLNSLLNLLIPNISTFADENAAIRASMSSAIMEETYRKQMLGNIEQLNKEAEALKNQCNAQATAVAQPTKEQESNKANLDKVSKLVLAFFLEFNDPIGNLRKQVRMYDCEHPFVGKIEYPISQHPIKDIVDAFEHTILLEQGLGSIGDYIAQDTKLHELNSTLDSVKKPPVKK